ncbi:hypothetical protein RHSIM_Rhsim02G0188100 [Rhododendron simsii]|uniref:Uncharacterized protein n=1 Tax=Rhododendron simsii TaxID=118357 RepID=A0A834HBD4_RHOSS|nr:hypothetical protein RHSIM_Rhsim02G0188100 [Rhododendron simsii]
MASVHLVPLSIRLPDFSAGAKNYRNSVTLASKKTPISVSFAVNSLESAPEVPEKPEIELEFIGPRPGDDGEYPMERARTVSGEKLLRNIMLDGKIELYAPYVRKGDELRRWWKLRDMHCGGKTLDSTIVLFKFLEIIEGQDLLNERTSTELRYLKKACLLCPHSLFLNQNHGGWHAKQLLEIKKILASSIKMSLYRSVTNSPFVPLVAFNHKHAMCYTPAEVRPLRFWFKGCLSGRSDDHDLAINTDALPAT